MCPEAAHRRSDRTTRFSAAFPPLRYGMLRDQGRGDGGLGACPLRFASGVHAKGRGL